MNAIDTLKETAPTVVTRLVQLQPGLYLFRYVSQHPPGQCPAVTVHSAPVGTGTVDFFPAEGVVANTLRRFGDCIIARVGGGDSMVLVAEFQPRAAALPVPAKIRIDRIDTSERLLEDTQATDTVATMPEFAEPAPTFDPFNEPFPDPFAPAAPSGADTPSGLSLRLTGHIERRGDVRVTDTWLGDPNGTARIEGFAIEWARRPEDVDLVYLCRSAASGQTPAIFSGGFAGTRGKAAPITMVAFALSGPGAINYRLSGQVVFAGSAPLSIEPGKKLSGPTGSEPLVAMRVLIVRKEGEVAMPRAASPWDDPTVTRIFRSA